jgi:cytochrome oxidase Cu insertion factor (SCO1/SenC/PrrC family)
MSLSQKNKGKLTLIGIFLLFFIPIITSWYLVFYTDFMHDAQGIQHGKLISPVISIGAIKAKEISTMDEVVIEKKWVLVFIQNNLCNEFCKERLYQVRQIRLALGEDRDKVDRLVIFNQINNLNELKDSYSGQKFIDQSFMNYQGLVKKFNDSYADKKNPIFLLDPYGFLMMQYPEGTEPKGIIKDIERLIRNSK